VTVGELYEDFRSDVFDTVKPYLWSDREVYRYMNDAYRMLVRKTGGIADSTSDLTQVQVKAGESYAEISPLILTFRLATLQSDGSKITIINAEDLDTITREDYGRITVVRPETPGRVTHMVIGSDRAGASAQVMWVQKPIVDDVVRLAIWRLPKDRITEDSDAFELSEINEEHHTHLMMWMKHLAYMKQDSETFDKERSDVSKALFEQYCRNVMAENDRYKHKVRVVRYGGL
jgi:hypothetical protein